MQSEQSKSGGTKYLRVLGRLHPDNRLILRPSYLTSNPRNSREPDTSPLTAELLDESGRLLLRHRLRAIPYTGDRMVFRELAVRGKVPFPAATRIVRFLRDGLVLHEIQVSKVAPKVQLNWSPKGTVAGTQKIRWQGKHEEGLLLHYFLRYSHNDGETWQRASFGTDQSDATIDFDQFPGGKACRLAVVATDGVNTVTAESGKFSVGVKPCRAIILSPGGGEVFAVGEPVLLQGQGFYLEENSPELEGLDWKSSRDGKLGTGRLLQTTELSDGDHKITLTAGTGPRAGQETVSIWIGERSC